MTITRDAALDAVRTIIRYVGEDPEREGLRETPDRVVRSWEKLYGGYQLQPEDVLAKRFQSEGYDQMVTLGPVELYSTCEHHLLPFIGYAWVGYLPGETRQVVGVSKLARLIEVYARRMQIQERLTDQIADALDAAISPRGVAVIITAQHQCMTSRGVEKQSSFMTTSSMRGVLRTDPKARAEFLEIVKAKS